MQSITLHSSAREKEPVDLPAEVARLEALLEARRLELAALQEEMRVFTAVYIERVGSRLAELSEIEREIKRAEARLLGLDQTDDEEPYRDENNNAPELLPVGKAMRRLFWAVAKMFHPDHASDEKEAERRHTVMAEASRAYSEGDVESLHTLLGDEHLQSLCAAAVVGADCETSDLQARLLELETELRTVEFRLKRTRQNSLYRTKLKMDAEASEARDALAQMAEGLDRQITKARHRLAHLT